MFHMNKPGKSFLNSEVYRDKVLGCWTGKNIGGTLGAPYEGKLELFDIHFYTQDLKGNPAPNDDLDLQLVWLKAIEEKGLFQINERVLGEYWLAHVTGPWNEYGVGKFNMANGFPPPLSGFCNNDVWKNSNGAWIRSEIWACLFPGEPDEAAPYAWYDACVDHADDGIYAEIFTTTLESAAFVESDLRKLISYALARIPADCRVARSVKIVLDAFDAGEDWKTARQKVLDDSADLGSFQAPANVSYAIIGLLYGKGDFGRSVCLAVNCGDDTDCSGATCGAVLGIINGRTGIPKEWIEPIGEAIKTVAIDPFHADAPATLDELTDRVVACKRIADLANPTLMRLTDGETVVDEALLARLADGSETVKRVLSKSSKYLTFEFPFGFFGIDFEKSPVIVPGESQELALEFFGGTHDDQTFSIEWHLPEGWSIAEGTEQRFMTYVGGRRKVTVTITAGEFSGAFEYIPVTFRLSGRSYPVYGTVPFQRAGVMGANGRYGVYQDYWDRRNQILARTAK